MTMEYRLRGAALKLEVTPTVDAVPTATADALLCRKIDLKPIELNTVQREVIRSFFGNFTSLVGAKFASVRLEVELAGFGTAGPTTPTAALDAAFRACAHSRTVTAGVDVTYSPITTSIPTVTVYVWQAGTLHKITGAFGELSMEMSEDQIPFWVFDLIGLYVPVIDVPLPTFTTSAYIEPVLCNSENTSAVSIRGYAAEVRRFSFKTSNQIERNALMGGLRRSRIVNRTASGSIELRATTVAMKNWWADIESASLGPMAILHGVTAGNRVAFASTAGLQLANPTFTEDRGMLNLSMDCIFVPTGAGNNEHALRFS